MRHSSVVAVVSLSLAAVLSCGDNATAPSASPPADSPPPPEPPHPARVTITPSTVALSALGATVYLGAAVVDQRGQTMSGVTVRWSSSDTTVATVDTSGLVTAVAAGGASIAATVDSISGAASVRVKQRVVAVRISPEAATAGVGDTLRLTAEPADANGHPVPEQVVRWSSSDTTVATVDTSGLVTAVAAGGASIAATVDLVSGAASVRVKQRVVAVRISPEAATAGVGDTLRLTAEPVDAKGRPVPGQVVRWSSSDMTVARVDDEGLVFGWGAGRAVISAAVGLGDPIGSAEVSFEGEVAHDRLALGRLYHRLGGRHWNRTDGWLTDAPLDSWFGVKTDSRQRVIDLSLSENALYGRLDSEIALLSELIGLDLSANDLWGPLPPELGKLDRLRTLKISRTAISGEIPSELAKLPRLEELRLLGNDLTGGIPDAIWEIPNLRELDLTGNKLTGSLSPKIKNLPALFHLGLSGNELSGTIPDELGELSRLASIALADNRLTGELPSGLGNLPHLETLRLNGNSGLSGRLPSAWGTRDQTVVLDILGTDICAPTELLEWLRKNRFLYIPLCVEREDAFAYLVQTIQSREFPVSLVADEEALLRVFVTAEGGGAHVPPVRARFWTGGRLTHTADLPGQSVPIPSAVDEGDLSRSVNARIPAQVVQPGLEMVIEIDPDGTLDPSLAIPKRIPREGRSPVVVRKVPTLELTAIPFLYVDNPDSTVLEYARDLNPETGLYARAWKLLPIVDVDVTVHDPVWTTSRFVSEMLRETEAIRVIEGRGGYFMGLMTHVDGGVAGEASYIGAPTFFSQVDPVTIAHELGHSMGLRHTRCGGAAAPDRRYPWPDGSIGGWGYDFAEDALVPPHAADLMGYCAAGWISSYHLGKSIRHRLEVEVAWGADAATATSLLVWGGADAEGRPFLKPAFVVDAPPALPTEVGDHQVTGYGADGEVLFSLSFAMPETAHLDGASSFVFAVPTVSRWEGALERITLVGPGGAATLDRESDQPMSIVRDPDTGRVHGFLTGLTPGIQALAGARAAPHWDGLEILSSRGIPDPSSGGGSGR